MHKITVLFFASYRDKAGGNSVEIEIEDGAMVGDLKTLLMQRSPALNPALTNALSSINQQYAFVEDTIPAGAVVAFFPPVSGGSGAHTIVKIVTEPLNSDDLVRQITFNSTGAACTFTGIVRGVTARDDPHETLSLEYEAYIPMAEAKMAQIADEIRQRWADIEGIAIVQRIGYLEPCTPTVVVACSAAHRDTGVFDAARYGIDRLKEIVPIWKKEIGPGGQTWVEGHYQPEKGD